MMSFSQPGIIGITDDGNETFIPFPSDNVLDCTNLTFKQYRLAVDGVVTMCVLGADYKAVPYETLQPPPIDPSDNTPQQPTDEPQTWSAKQVSNVISTDIITGTIQSYTLNLSEWENTPNSSMYLDRCHIYAVIDSQGQVIGTSSYARTESSIDVSYQIYTLVQANPSAYRVAFCEANAQTNPNAKAPRLLKRSDTVVNIDGDWITYGPMTTLIDEPQNTTLGPQHYEIINANTKPQVTYMVTLKDYTNPQTKLWPGSDGSGSSLWLWEIPLAPGEEIQVPPLPLYP